MEFVDGKTLEELIGRKGLARVLDLRLTKLTAEPPARCRPAAVAARTKARPVLKMVVFLKSGHPSVMT